MTTNDIFEDYELIQSTKDRDNNTIIDLDNSFDQYENDTNSINISFNQIAFNESIMVINPKEMNSIFKNLYDEPIISNIPKPNNNLEKKNNLLGRKTKKSGEIGTHNKYSQDNMIRKFKVLIKDKLLEHINSKIKKEIDLTLIIDNKEYKVDKILNINQKQIKDTNVLGNRTLLNKTLRNIFSDEIAGRYSNYPKNYNKIVIDKFYELNIQNITCILDLTFLECIKYFRKEKELLEGDRYNCLRGIEKNFENLPNELKKEKYDDKYIFELLELIKNFEEIYFKKNPRLGRLLKKESKEEKDF